MGLIIKATETKKINITGTSIEIPEVYGRLRFLGDFAGKTIQGEIMTFTSKTTYLENKNIYTDVPIGSFNVELAIGETQSVDTAHKYAKQAYENMGYEVIIDLN